MNILLTGARGMVGTALVANLKNIKENKNRTRPALHIDEVYEYDIDSSPEELDAYCKNADFVFNLAGVNRPEKTEDFMKGNFGFASTLLDTLKKYDNKATIMLSSSIQATLAGRFGDSEYGRSKKAGEELFFNYAAETGAKVAVYRFPNLMGHSRPKYNSAVSTFCWAVANDKEFTVNDRSTELELLYIDDLVEGMFDLLEGKEVHCEFDGVETVVDPCGRYCCVPVTHKVTLGEIVDLLEEFKRQPVKRHRFSDPVLEIYRERLSPVSLAGEYRVTQTVIYLPVAYSMLLDIIYCSRNSFLDCHSVEET